MSVKVFEVKGGTLVGEFASVLEAAVASVEAIPTETKTILENGFSTQTNWAKFSQESPLSFAIMTGGKQST